MNFAKFLRIPFFIENLRWLLLKIDEIALLLRLPSKPSTERNDDKTEY